MQIDLSAFLPSLFGALTGGAISFFIARFITLRSQTYANLDNLYSKILDVYFECPKFLKSDHTNAYKSAFLAEERDKYDAFARRVFTFLETVYDTRYDRKNKDIDRQWRNTFEDEFIRHKAWYKDNRAYVSDYFREFLDSRETQHTSRG